MKLASPVLSDSIANLVNMSFNEASFPENMKVAQVVPVHKKSSNLDKSNYRPVSLLPVMSKIYERATMSSYCNIIMIFETLFLVPLYHIKAVIQLIAKLLKIGKVS